MGFAGSHPLSYDISPLKFSLLRRDLTAFMLGRYATHTPLNNYRKHVEKTFGTTVPTGLGRPYT